MTLPDLLRVPHECRRIGLLIVLLTLTAAWIDMLSYLSLGRVFASFMTGNLLFIGLGAVQGNSGFLIRALVAVLVFLVGVTFGSFCLERAPQQQCRTAWHHTFARHLLMEWLLLLVYAILWRVTSNLSQQAGAQILLLCLAALGMGIQGALVLAFKIPGVVADAVTATLITLGQRLAHRLDHQGPQRQEWRWSGLFLALLCLIYVGSAVVVALTSAFMLTPVVPVIVMTIAILALRIPWVVGFQGVYCLTAEVWELSPLLHFFLRYYRQRACKETYPSGSSASASCLSRDKRSPYPNQRP